MTFDFLNISLGEDGEDTGAGSENQSVVGYLLIKRALIEGANAISGPATYGFPSVAAFLGGFHAISRKLSTIQELAGVSLDGVLLACHECIPCVYRPNKFSEYTFNQTRNPIRRNGSTAPITEEGKCRLVMTFSVEVVAKKPLTDLQVELLVQHVNTLVWQHRMAGGSVQKLAAANPVQFFSYDKVDEIKPHLVPAFILIQAHDEMAEIIAKIQEQDPEATSFDALIDVCCLHHIPSKPLDESEKVKWQTMSHKSGRGWLIPIPVGYQGISAAYEPGIMQNTRNPEYSSQYVEALYGLGKWVYPHRLSGIEGNCDIADAFWRYSHEPKNNLYLVHQGREPAIQSTL